MKSALQPSICCPGCGSKADAIGPIPATDVFAGRLLENPLEGGWLYRCRTCLLGFRWPRLSKNKLDKLYEQGGEHAWTSSGQSRHDWIIGRDWIAQALVSGESILDVGCFDGGFLERLVGLYKCYGIEIHPQARLRAESKGISMIGADFSEVNGQFDCVTAFDVIEHVENPALFLSQCLDAVRPGGHVLISTGNLDSFTFHRMGGRYWYCTIAEHISFVSPRWFYRNLSDMGCKVVQIKTFAHDKASVIRRVKELIANTLYWVHPSLLGSLRKIGFGQKNLVRHPILAEHPPGWGTARDHFIVMLKKL